MACQTHPYLHFLSVPFIHFFRILYLTCVWIIFNSKLMCLFVENKNLPKKKKKTKKGVLHEIFYCLCQCHLWTKQMCHTLKVRSLFKKKSYRNFLGISFVY